MQGTGAMTFVRDQGFNVAVAAVAGVSTLGLWTLVVRIIQIPGVLLTALWRVSFPALSRLLAAGEDVRHTLERGSALVAIAAGAILTPIVGAGPHLVAAVFGAPWADAADALPAVGLGLMIVGPVSVAAAGYLAASGDAATVLKSATFHTIAIFAVALPLLPWLGLWALGFGTLVSCVVEAAILGVKAGRDSGARIFAPTVAPTAVAVVASGTGWYLGTVLEHSLLSAVVCAALAELIYLGVLVVVKKSVMAELRGTIVRSIRPAR
jgi:O-antigen/teichoic acid export membrane protein